MPISVERIQNDIAAIARATQSPAGCVTRVAFSPQWGDARDYVAFQLEAAGCDVRIDAAGNLHARPNAISWDAPAWLSGSHLDTIPNGGNYDGVIGIVAALECLRAAREDVKIALPLEMVVWAANEATFGAGMVGSRAFVGDFDDVKLATLKNSNGQSYTDAGAAYGVAPEKLATDRLRPASVVGYIEVHAEEGLRLWNQDSPAGCVTTMAGRRQYVCQLHGLATHAGATSMEDRIDALAGAADAIVALEKLAQELGRDTVITVGRIISQPNVINVIASLVELTIDLRSPVTMMLVSGDQAIRKTLERIANQRRLQFSLDLTDSRTGVDLDARICAKMLRSAQARRVEPVLEMASGVFHDATILAPHVPSAMLFVPSRDGIAHSAEEFTRNEDIASAVAILLETVRDRRLE